MYIQYRTVIDYVPSILSPQTLGAIFSGFAFGTTPHVIQTSSPDFALSVARKRVVGLSKSGLSYGGFPPVPTPPDATASLPKRVSPYWP